MREQLRVMKRNSTLYDYKPRLEWTDSMASEKQKTGKKIFLLVIGLTIATAAIFTASDLFTNFLSKPLSSTSAILEVDKTKNSKQISRTLELTPLVSHIEKKTLPEIKIVEESKQNDVEKIYPLVVETDENIEVATPIAPPKPISKIEPQSVSIEKTEEPIAYQPKEILLPKDLWQTVTVKDGDNLSLIFSRLAINKNDLYEILSLGNKTQSLKRLRPGQILRLKFEDSKIEELIHESDLTHTLKVKKMDDEFEAKIVEEKPDIKVATSTGKIQDSLFLSGQKAGLSDNVIMQMFDIFGWDIDFVLDIREDDQFRVIYEELYKNDKKIKDGKILAAEFINQGRVLKAVRYIDSEDQPGYYSEQGKSMRKAFLRTPVNFTRISSHFNLSRKHPVLNKIRAHKGVDYAAPLGTPIKSTGNGKVLFVGTKNGYGNTVIIQHGGKYTTLYAHLSRFSRGLKNGKRVEQGQTIAYVGKTGLATGPHLHYEFRVNGVHRNPLTVDLPKSLPLPKKYMKDFIQKTKSLLTRLASLSDETEIRHITDAEDTEQDLPQKIDVAISHHRKPLETIIN